MLGRALLRPATRGDEPALRRLVRALRPFLLRRAKEQVLSDLPAKTEQTTYAAVVLCWPRSVAAGDAHERDC